MKALDLLFRTVILALGALILHESFVSVDVASSSSEWEEKNANRWVDDVAIMVRNQTNPVIIDDNVEAAETLEVELQQQLEEEEEEIIELVDREEDVVQRTNEETPTTTTTIPSWYNENSNYFVYQPSGGLSNQRKIMEWAINVCIILNRTCVLPYVAPHSTWWYKYNAFSIDDSISSSNLFDIEQIKKIANVVTLEGQTLKDFVSEHENKLGGEWFKVMRNKLGEKRLNQWNKPELVSLFSTEKKKFLYFAEGTMWQCFDFSPEEMEPIRRHLAFHKAIRKKASDVVHFLFGKNGRNGTMNFDALHIRFSDGEAIEVRSGWLSPSASFASRMARAAFQRAVYVATVPKKLTSSYFNSLKKKYDLFNSSSIPSTMLHPFLEGFSPKIRTDVIGAIEQLVCARSRKFLGTGFSTFSESIRQMRRYRELVTVFGEDEAFYANIVTPCKKEREVC